MKLAVDIERIVIDDGALVAGRADRIGPLVEAELERRLRDEPLGSTPGARERVHVKPLTAVPDSDEELARELAARIVESLGGGAS